MILNSEPVKNWFGYTRRERRASSILVAIIFLVIGLRFFLPEKNIEIEDLSSLPLVRAVIHDNPGSGAARVNTLFTFDPNTATYDTLIRLGFGTREANSIIKYRNMGGKFRKPSDLRKFQGIDSTLAEELESYAVISPVKSGSIVQVSKVSHVPTKALLDINSCDSLSLVALPGIGPVLSSRIIKYRKLLGGFAHVEQLKEVYGLPPETYEMIAGRLFADSSSIRKVNINSAGYRELFQIPYIEKYEVSAILKYRELSGRIKSIEDLKENKILSPEKAGKVVPYLDFR